MNSKQRRIEKRHPSGVRHNPKKVGRPPKIGVEKGFGPRHGANAKEGEEVDLTKIPTDTVPAMLTEREAVLNRNAAELAGRDEIEALNQQGNELARKGVDLAAGGDEDVEESRMVGKIDRTGASPLLSELAGMVEGDRRKEMKDLIRRHLTSGHQVFTHEQFDYNDPLVREVLKELGAGANPVPDEEMYPSGQQRGTSDMKNKMKNSKPKQSSSGSPYVQGFEAQKAKGYEGGVAKLPKPGESVGSLGTPAGYTNTNKWGKAYGWNPGTPPQLGGGPDSRGNGPFPEPPGGILGQPRGPGDNRYIGGPTPAIPPSGVGAGFGGSLLGQPGGTQNVNQYGVAYGWNPGGGASMPGLGGGGGQQVPYPMPLQGNPPGGLSAWPQPLKSGGLYPPGQGIFHGATGASDILGEGESIYGNSAPVNLSAPSGLAEMVAALKKEASKQGLSPSQIQGILGAFQGMGGGGGYANQSPSAGEDFGNPNYIGLGTPSYQGGISEVGYPPGIAPGAVFSYEEGGWTGPLDPRWSSPGYQGGTSGVPGLYQGEHDFRGGGPSTIGSGGRDFTGNPRIGLGPGFPPADESTDPADRFSGNRPFGPDLRMAWMGGGRLGYQPPPWAAGFSQGPTMIPTTLGNSGYPRAVLASSDWNKSGAPSHTPRKNRS